MNEDRFVRESLTNVERSITIADEILRLCFLSLESKDHSILSRLEILLADFSNHLRSSLNDFSQAVVAARGTGKAKIGKSEKSGENIGFPWAQDKTDFDKNPGTQAIKEVSENLYNAYESLQPYYAENEWLAYLMLLRSQDQDGIITRVDSPNTTGFAGHLADGVNLEIPKFEGDKLLMPSADGIIAAQLPFYFAPLQAFATREHTWSTFMISMKEKGDLDLVDFIQTTPIKVVKILSTLDPTFGSHFTALFEDEVENQ